MALVSVKDLHLGFGGPELLDGISLTVERGERVAILGRNGAGKSTMLALMSGQLPPDAGTVLCEKGARIGFFSQKLPSNIKGSAKSIVMKALEERYAGLEHEMTAPLETETERICDKVGIEANLNYETASGGQKRRILLAKALAPKPDILYLDEPTNHLDLPAILWLEETLLDPSLTIVFVTHDRAFLRRIANRIIEIDRGRLFDWQCPYDQFLERKEAWLIAEEKANDAFDKKLAIEEAWRRKGVRARRTRNEGRAKRLIELRKERGDRRNQEGTASMQLKSSNLSGKVVIEAENISFAYDTKPIIKDFSTIIGRGDKIGIMGRNGSGKTTLVRLLLGELQAKSGNVKIGTKIDLAYLDQLRSTIDDNKTVKENVIEDGDTVYPGGIARNIYGYLEDFLFSPERSKVPAKNLSGGERNRLLLARLFTSPINVLVMDEPTNDLDAETIELLEDLLVEFQGTLLLVCHDREFLDNVVTSTVVFNDDMTICEYAGGYTDYLSQSKGLREKEKEKAQDKKEGVKENQPKEKTKKKLSFAEKAELEKLPADIEALEAEIESLHTKMADIEYIKNKDLMIKAKERLAEIEVILPIRYARWEELESLANSLGN